MSVEHRESRVNEPIHYYSLQLWFDRRNDESSREVGETWIPGVFFNTDFADSTITSHHALLDLTLAGRGSSDSG